MAGTRKPIAAHTSVVALLIGGLPRGTQSHDNVARLDVSVVNHIGTTHAACDGRVDNDGAYQVAHIGRLATSKRDADAHST